MPTDHSSPLERTPHHLEHELTVDADSPLALRHFTRTISRYRLVILTALAAIVLAYLIFAVAFILMTPTQRTTSQSFRLDFEGAGDGKYPNGTKFNVADIVATPILLKVHEANHLGEYLEFGQFSRAVFILESNPAYERLAAEYQAAMADSRLTPVDRERLQREFDMKTRSIAKNEYAISFARNLGTKTVPDVVARKVLIDILSGWADFAVNQQHVIAYQVSVLSPEILRPSALENGNAVAALEVLRAKTNHVIDNISKIAKLPGAPLARTADDRVSLEEVRIRMEETIRFRLEPLLNAAVHSPSLVGDRAAAIRFLETQLAYDQRQLESAQRAADSKRDALTVYEEPALAETTTVRPAVVTAQPKSGDAVVPQLSDSFLDRLMSMSGRAADAEYRQSLVTEYMNASGMAIPLKAAVAYDQQILAEVKSGIAGPTNLTAEDFRAQIDQTRTEVGQLIGKVNILFQTISNNMTPSTQLFTFTGPPVTRTLRGVEPRRVMLYGLLLVLLSVPAIVIACLLHNRIREEEAAEAGQATT